MLGSRLILWILLVPFILKGAFCRAADPSLLILSTHEDSLKTVDSLVGQAQSFIQSGKSENALKTASLAYGIAENCGDTLRMAGIQQLLGNYWSVKGDHKASLTHFWASARLDKGKTGKGLAKTYYKMALTCARLKLYSLSLRLFNKYQHISEKQGKAGPPNADTVKQLVTIYQYPPENKIDTQFVVVHSPQSLIQVELLPDSLMQRDTLFVDNEKVNPKSRKVRWKEDIIEPFHDGKAAIAYGVIVLVKQPSYGSRRKFRFLNVVGHTFITMVKFNEDNSTVVRTFGFYPEKDNFFSATPLAPSTSSVFKNDSLHVWDELAGKFVSQKQFDLILDMVQHYHRKKYHLSRNNCTDFGLVVANIAGIDISETLGSWPGGKGNNPADMGESMKEGMVKDNGHVLDPEEPSLLWGTAKEDPQL